jgi:hypothetical protein
LKFADDSGLDDQVLWACGTAAAVSVGTFEGWMTDVTAAASILSCQSMEKSAVAALDVLLLKAAPKQSLKSTTKQPAQLSCCSQAAHCGYSTSASAPADAGDNPVVQNWVATHLDSCTLQCLQSRAPLTAEELAANVPLPTNSTDSR